MIYLNYLQAKLQPDIDNRKGMLIANNILPRCNLTSHKKVEPALLCITSCLCGHPHTGTPVSAIALRYIA